jgi:hypothetical protein
MNARDFLLRTVGDDGVYCLFAHNRESDRKKQTFYDNIDALLSAANSYDDKGYDVYFALATFNDGSSRTQTNVRQLRSLFLDLDCGEDKAENNEGYIDQATALQALQDFSRRLALPRPIVVNSGRGVHVYWNLKTPVALAQWLPVAKKLKQLCVQHGFLADPNVTADAARILRIPGTHNYKADPPLEVVTWEGPSVPQLVELSELAELLGVNSFAPTASRVAIPEGMSAMQEMLAGNTPSSFRKLLERTMDGTGCQQIADMVAEPRSVSEPMWRAGLSIAAHCDDAEKAIQVVSGALAPPELQHPDYDPDVADRKARNTKGPYTCAKFDDYRPGVCTLCPHWGQIKSPIVLGRDFKAAEDEERVIEAPDADTGFVKQYVVPKLPKPYVRGGTGGIYKSVKNEDGDTEQVLVYPHDMYVVRRIYDAVAQEESLLMRLHLPKDGIREFVTPTSQVQSPQDFRKQLAAKGVTLRTGEQWNNMGYYVMDWIEDLQMNATADTATRQFGWTDGHRSFLVGDREYVPGAVRNNAPTAATSRYFKHFQPKGALEDWVSLIETYNQPGLEVYQLVVCAGFGAPLMEFSAVHGLTIHLNSTTGYGKTTVQYAAQSIWGSPEQLAMSQRDTTNSKMNRMEVFKNLFVMFDEMTNTTPEEISDIVYAVTEGRQRNRLAGGANEERDRGDPWSTLLVTSANASFYDKLDAVKAENQAEKERVFEIHLTKHVQAGAKPEMDHLEYALKNECYGHAGDVYARYLVDHVDEIRDQFRNLQQKLDKAADLTSVQRFQSAGFAATLLGGVIANALGLVRFDMEQLFWYTVDLLKESAENKVKTQKSPSEYLNEYIAEHWNDILKIKSTQRHQGTTPEPGIDELIVPEASPRMQYVARYETDVNRLYLMPKPFKVWCTKQQLSPEILLAGLEKTHPVRRGVAVRLGKGTSFGKLPPTKVYVIDMVSDIAAADEDDEQ